MTTLSELQYKSYIKTIIFCPKCLSIPILSILPSNFSVKVICSCGTRIVDINTYLTEKENSNASIPSKSIKCYIYKDSDISHQKFLAFCFDCIKHFCKECDKGHEEHRIIYINQIKKK